MSEYPKGSITKLKNGSYRASIWIRGERFTKQSPRRRLLDEWLAEKVKHKLRVEAGLDAEPGEREDVTHAELKEDLLSWYKAGTDRVRTSETIRGYRSDLSAVVKRFGDMPVKDVTTAEINAWVADMRGQKLATSTIRNRLCRLSQLHQLAVESGYIGKRPCEIKLPRLTLKSRRQAAPEELLTGMLKATDGNQRARAVVLLAADAGLRASEIARLRGGDVDLERGWLHIAVRSETDRTKSGKGRDVPILTDRLKEALRPLLFGPDDPLLVTVTSYEGLRYFMGPVFKAATESESLRLHELRHRWVTQLLERGVNPLKVQAWAGHEDLKTTLGYAHVSPEPDEAAREALSPNSPDGNPSSESGGTFSARRGGSEGRARGHLRLVK